MDIIDIFNSMISWLPDFVQTFIRAYLFVFCTVCFAELVSKVVASVRAGRSLL